MFQKVSEVGGDRLVAAMGGAGVSEMVECCFLDTKGWKSLTGPPGPNERISGLEACMRTLGPPLHGKRAAV